MDTIPQKHCTGPCGRTLPATLEFFHVCKTGKYGLRARCKECVSTCERQSEAYKQKLERRKRNYSANPEIRERSRAACKAYRESSKGREWQQAYYQSHFSEIRAYQAVYRTTYHTHHDYREYNRIHVAAYRRSLSGQAKARAYNRLPHVLAAQKARQRVRRSCPEIREHNHAYNRAYTSRPEYQEQRRPRERVNSHNRRARKKSIAGTHTVEQIQEQLKRQRYRCYYAACGHAKFEKRKGKYVYHIEHTFPISRIAGTNIPANDMSYLVLACPTCNMQKHDKFPWEWPEGGRLL